MSHLEPLPLHHSWPLFDLREHMASCGTDLPLDWLDGDALASRGVGLWHCDLADNRLSWTRGVHEIFGVPGGAIISREHSVSLYDPASREVMERLRSYAIRHRRGFTIDIDIDGADGVRRRARLIAAPLLVGNRVVALRGVKQDVTNVVPAPRFGMSAAMPTLF